MSSTKSNSGSSGSSGRKRILYDAHGTRVKGSIFSNKYVKFLLFYVIPYFVINGIILLLVCSTPSISVELKDTNNYITTEAVFTVKSILPIKELNVSLESEPIEYEKSGSSYKCTVSKNGTLFIEAKALNGMARSNYTDVGILDDTAPSVDESSINISRGDLSFTISDTQSGVNYDSIIGIINDSEEIRPADYDKNTGYVTFKIPKMTDSIELRFEDMVGNARSGRISLTTEGSITDSSITDSSEAENSVSIDTQTDETAAAQ
ncbi:MAG: hypothetical protein Q4E57_11080 [Eubacteriales bacterium]|nr:hypothetical protein [Eubacteriales bacterium]